MYYTASSDTHQSDSSQELHLPTFGSDEEGMATRDVSFRNGNKIDIFFPSEKNSGGSRREQFGCAVLTARS